MPVLQRSVGTHERFLNGLFSVGVAEDSRAVTHQGGTLSAER
jgi:hypothetical protein